ncbi:BgTH12-06900 [Blumeria graminis f. sp. triticale]|uniref:Zinc transporter n=4 Tax=Blumeria graminis TaxID=34373 RepID=A0A656KHW4_BLUGR|nr:hypothetical protein BGT96224_4891 [Blumeria graminis f. sp. tritici 96224]CAD6505968.1 BgTH12-06900 [Blumeria graminis f. sp. triticale]VDB94576.1 Bgt-4891 [Blumeria graminis f. sp. tritici]
MTTNHISPVPPRTPSPPSPGADYQEQTESSNIVRTAITFNPDALSPFTDSFSGQFGSMNTPLPSMNSDGSVNSLWPSGQRNPFNFAPQTTTGSPMLVNSNIGKRRGHRYKHSSVSTQHQIFLEPPSRALLALPASLPVPTYREAWSSRSKEQTRRIVWCTCHAFIALYVLYSAAGSLALTALSHLIFFDAISATICVVIDVLCNFEVWKRSSIRHPFGLERAEVLAGFAMSVFLLFLGFDLISHNLKHVLEGISVLRSHQKSADHRISIGSIDSAALLSIIATLISAIGLQNHARIGKTMRYSYISSLPSVLSNPSHFLTLFSSTVMLLLPLLSSNLFHWIDTFLCALIAISMFTLGVHFATTQGLMLLMSYSGEGIGDVIREIKREEAVICVEEARFWQIHYALCMASFKLRVKGDELTLSKLRERINLFVSKRLGTGYGTSEVKWEVTTQFILEK